MTEPLKGLKEISFEEFKSILTASTNNQKITVQGHEFDGSHQFSHREFDDMLSSLVGKISNLSDAQRAAMHARALGLEDPNQNLKSVITNLDRIASGRLNQEDF